MPEQEIHSLTTEERTLAGLAHISVIVPFLGILAPIVIWATQSDKDPQVRFQALQAAIFQSFIFLVGNLIPSMLLVLTLVNAMLLAGQGYSGKEPLTGIPAFLFMSAFCCSATGILSQPFLMLYGLIGAIRNFQGMPFQYWFIGKLAQRYLKS